jgi:hypothetical protein
MGERFSRHAGVAALVLSVLSLVLSASGLASAARRAVEGGAAKAKSKAGSHPARVASVDGHRLSSKPYPNGVLLLGAAKRFPAAAIPTVKNADELSGKKLEEVEPSCPPDTVNLGTWCLEASPYPVGSQNQGLNNFFWASQTCVKAGGWLPSASQLIGAATRVRLESTIHDNPATATVDQEPADGLKDAREMSSTLVTTAAGSEAAGSEGVSAGSLGDPRTGEPNPVPEPAVPEPETLQYVTIYSNGTKGGFAGSESVGHAENFRCAYDKYPGANKGEEE